MMFHGVKLEELDSLYKVYCLFETDKCNFDKKSESTC